MNVYSTAVLFTPMRDTIKEGAREAGVSVATVPVGVLRPDLFGACYAEVIRESCGGHL